MEKKRNASGGRHTAFDSELIRAKKDKTPVKIHLPFETEFTNKDCSCKGVIENVDVYSVKMNIDGQGVWVSKAFIVGVEL